MGKAIDLVRKFYPDVQKVKDATRQLDVTVGKQDINNSQIKNHKECVFAHACKRMQDIDGAIIAIKSAYIIKGDTAIRYTVPDSLAREIIAFDRHGSFEEGEYYISEPPPSYRLKKPRKLREDARRGPDRHVNRRSNKKQWHATKSIRSFNNPE